MHDEKKKNSLWKQLAPVLHLCPAALTLALVMVTLPLTRPVLAALPERLAASETAERAGNKETAENQEEDEAAEETAETENLTTLSSDSYTAPKNGYADGTYYGSARGFGGTIKVKVVISGGKISSVTIVSAPGETASYLSKAKGVISRIVGANSPNVDTVSGATYSSNGIINAVKRALSQAGSKSTTTIVENPVQEEPALPTPAEPETPVDPEETYKDGVYIGTAEGFGGDITVQVTIEKGRITKVEILSAEDETPSYLKRASVLLTTIQNYQSTEVDVISGATYSSKGILEATRLALTQALAETPDTDTSENQTPSETPETTPNEPDAETPETTPTEPDTETPDTGDPGDREETPETALYTDGVYTAAAACTDEDIFSYQVKTTVTVAEGKITQITVEKESDTSEDPSANDTYLKYALEGRTRKNIWYESVTKQILQKQAADTVDVVSGATYSSRAITTAVKEALNLAKGETGK